ncbi:RNase P subunit [Nitrososphaera sp.]|uniref:ribonuclease P protein component 4 n=1 Tax=Nitrososphaera sp. TaxID=1971748 RepID=UPI00307F80A8
MGDSKKHVRKKQQAVKEIARERIEILLASALQERDLELAEKQAGLAKKIAMRHRVRLPYRLRQLFCKKCKAFIVPGRDSRVRTGRSRTRAVRITCARCGHTYRKVIAARRNKDL